MQLYRLDPLFTVRGPRPAATATDRRATAGPATDGTVRLATCCRFASAAFLASGQLVLMGPPGQAVRVLPWPSDPHLRPAALAFKPSGKRLLVVTAIGWLAVVPVRELLATPNVRTHSAQSHALHDTLYLNPPRVFLLSIIAHFAHLSLTSG